MKNQKETSARQALYKAVAKRTLSFIPKTIQKKWRHPNASILHGVAAKMSLALREHDFFQSVLLQFSLIEIALRYSVVSKATNGTGRKIAFDSNTKISNLIDCLGLLGVDDRLINKLREYNKKRNQLVHGILQFTDYQSLNIEAGKAFILGEEIRDSIIKADLF